MPWPAYSERIVSTPGHVGWKTIVVPAGRRAVIKHVAVAKYSSVTSYYQVAVAGMAVWARALPGDLGGYQDAVMWVAYGGEQIGIYMDHESGGVTLCGYVFDDTAAAARGLELDAWDPPAIELGAPIGAP